MPTVTIDGEEYQATPLTPTQLLQWQAFIARLKDLRFWVDLMEQLKPLPVAWQLSVIGRSSPPENVKAVRYFELATRVESVVYLLYLTMAGGQPAVTESNAAEIYAELEPLILNKPVVLSGGEGLAKMREGANAGSE